MIYLALTELRPSFFGKLIWNFLPKMLLFFLFFFVIGWRGGAGESTCRSTCRWNRGQAFAGHGKHLAAVGGCV